MLICDTGAAHVPTQQCSAQFVKDRDLWFSSNRTVGIHACNTFKCWF